MTREEIIEAIQNDNMMPFLQDWEARDIVDFVLKNIQPSLPDGLEEEIKRFLSNATKMNKGEWRGKYPISDIGFRAVARHFAEWGRKQVLQEIYEGKVKPVDKITAAWLDDESKAKEDKNESI